VFGTVLSVAVELDGLVIAIFPGIDIPRLHSSADAHVQRQRYDLDSERLGNPGCLVVFGE